MSDLISRADVEQTVEDNILCYTHSDRPIDQDPDTECHMAIRTALRMLRKDLRKLPSAQPERKKGRWIERNPQNSDKCRLIECDQCGFSHIVGFNVPYEHWIENRNFCERCGADMRCEDDNIPMEYFESGGI